MEDHLVSSIGRDVVSEGCLELERDRVADVVVGGILPIGGGVCGAVVGVLNLLFGSGSAHLGRNGSGADNLDNIQGIGFAVTYWAVVLDQIVAGGCGQRITIGNRTEFFRIQIHIFLNLR